MRERVKERLFIWDISTKISRTGSNVVLIEASLMLLTPSEQLIISNGTTPNEIFLFVSSRWFRHI